MPRHRGSGARLEVGLDMCAGNETAHSLTLFPAPAARQSILRPGRCARWLKSVSSIWPRTRSYVPALSTDHGSLRPARPRPVVRSERLAHDSGRCVVSVEPGLRREVLDLSWSGRDALPGEVDVPGQQFGDAIDRVVGDAAEHVTQVGFGVEAVQFRRLDQRDRADGDAADREATNGAARWSGSASTSRAKLRVLRCRIS
jgi:hypothetical protein